MKAMQDSRDTGTTTPFQSDKQKKTPGDAMEERYRRIQELAYRKAERRGFAPGGEWQDRLEAEREVDNAVRPASLHAVSREAPAAHARRETIEHRQGERVAVRFPVRLRKCDGPVYCGVVCNVGPDGMFVRTPANLSKGCCFEICVDAPDEAASWDSFSIPAFAVHEANCGLGLLFRPMDEAASAAVQRLRKGAHPLSSETGDWAVAATPGDARRHRQA
jgi:hypothetical protein